jgi:P-aminobenzoate N-oxygenase AurF
VSETLISSSLLRIPRAPGVLPAVRQLVADHASDEWRHHAFFAHVCQLAWPRMPDSARRVIGPSIPRCIVEFLSADRPALMTFLERQVGPARAADILAESFPASEVAAQARCAARASIRVFQQAGLFEHAEVVDAFAAHGLGDGRD